MFRDSAVFSGSWMQTSKLPIPHFVKIFRSFIQHFQQYASSDYRKQEIHQRRQDARVQVVYKTNFAFWNQGRGASGGRASRGGGFGL